MENYQKEIFEWQQSLDTKLRKENSWLALAGLYWLEAGENTFGSKKSNDLIFPDDSLPEVIGSFIVGGEGVKLKITGDPIVSLDGEFIKEAFLQPDVSGSPTKLSIGDLTFILIQREDGFGIRLWDNGRPERETFPGRQWFPIQDEFRISGSYKRYETEHHITFQRNNGEDFEAQVGGIVSFSLDGKDCSLLAFEEAEGDLFILFRDPTNETETYSAGRYLVVSTPKDGKVIVDFNRAYNPPCAFTNFATCPLPPAQNKLVIPITAGEEKAPPISSYATR